MTPNQYAKHVASLETEQQYIRKHLTRFDQFCFWSPALCVPPFFIMIFYVITQDPFGYVVSASALVATFLLAVALRAVALPSRVEQLRMQWYLKNNPG